MKDLLRLKTKKEKKSEYNRKRTNSAVMSCRFNWVPMVSI